ncbi:hypothetical protein BRADI_1g32463v3 [Brachypodium distachyon]|uniref:Uncharacterized protein n=1 Tax=Brachypodium distachyon TaxID=15368 RepID=A0A0Q3L1E0_BRADI|nr:hypothetical protein BRADI_1g32463v3 [Brachypodium distachyon]
MTLTRGCGWRRGRARRTWGWSAWWRASACRTACYCGLNEQASTADSSAAAASTTVGLYELGGHNDFTPAGTTISPDFTVLGKICVYILYSEVIQRLRMRTQSFRRMWKKTEVPL